MRTRIFVGTPPEVDITKLDETKVRELLQLCHPDRHSNSPLSTRIFDWLMKVRQELDKKKKPA